MSLFVNVTYTAERDRGLRFQEIVKGEIGTTYAIGMPCVCIMVQGRSTDDQLLVTVGASDSSTYVDTTGGVSLQEGGRNTLLRDESNDMPRVHLFRFNPHR